MMRISEGFLRGLEKPVILWLLSRRPMYGYEIMAEFMRLTGRRLKPSIIYPFLRRLEAEGFASVQWSVNGKRRIKSYTLTEKGELLLGKVRKIFAQIMKEFFLELMEK
ncbi:MAG: PadR family transcriptional regulator [Candidatus Bathyarchaeota archaeon]|nr:PadR family transcriptional regulator [Candidatus Bathyarchaeota archaeon]